MELVQNKTSKEKQKTYAYLKKRFELAKRHQFYLEALMIVYNIIEDRLIALLHYAGVVSRDQENLRVVRKIRPHIIELLGKKPTDQIQVRNADVKISILMALAKIKRTNNPYLSDVHNQMENTVKDIEDFIQLLNRYKEWKETRNRMVHGLTNKVPSSVETVGEEVAMDGMNIANELDKYVDRFKRHNNIRRKYRIQ
ncbi:MAG: hypothetical protein J5518_01665 [Lachnospiraceae bacterium]|nr:hypothetical protein [Lachnospiraceae bacterium]